MPLFYYNMDMESKLLEECMLCGHRCKVNRLKGQLGRCRAGLKPRVASYCAHHGEEPMISGRRGSGTIFFAGCCLRCVYCQNYEISQSGKGRELGTEELGEMMLELQGREVHNINFVSPTHYGPQIIEALHLARQRGLKLPVVYNTGGFDSLELLKQLDGLVDIYMPDLKYFDNNKALKYSGAGNYVEVAKAGIVEMFHQAKILVRHLVLPNGLSDSEKVLDFLASLSKDIWISLMAQYNPQYKAKEFPGLSRRLKPEEYQNAVDHAEEIGLRHVYVQDLTSSETYLPDFKRVNPFGTR